MSESGIVVWDRNGKYFQTWQSNYKGSGIKHGMSIARQIGGSYAVVSRPQALQDLADADRDLL